MTPKSIFLEGWVKHIKNSLPHEPLKILVDSNYCIPYSVFSDALRIEACTAWDAIEREWEIVKLPTPYRCNNDDDRLAITRTDGGKIISARYFDDGTVYSVNRSGISI
jgi:hypothetical protein